jgi:hypothetical protein
MVDLLITGRKHELKLVLKVDNTNEIDAWIKENETELNEYLDNIEQGISEGTLECILK